ncbi:MLO-like protein 15 [Rhodamnia argentea]|uniref:MLO-like protein n=1 Tax=Rhodamnia argentea TaxID=178133 RepID=A0ABM3GSL7_9MYRT|nr:MLO-like protein 15 [Rhodamnia argentea]
MADIGGEGKTLEFTPSWVVALVCFSIVLISLAVDKFLLCAGQLLEKSNDRMPLVSALRKIKEELMLLGFISLLLAVFQTRIGKICIPERLANEWLPCKRRDSSSATARFADFFPSAGTRGRRLLAEASASTDFCSEKGKVPLLTAEALHHLDIFLFVLATFHVILCVFKILLGYKKIHQWRDVADLEVRKENYYKLQQEVRQKQVQRGCLARTGNKWKALGWMGSFFKQFYPSVTEFEYSALHLNYMARHLTRKGETFHNYIVGAVKKDFEKIVGISWYLWLFAVIFLLLNVAGWHALFWISFIPLTLLLITGTILEHMITRLAEGVTSSLVIGKVDSAKEFSSCYVCFLNPRFVLLLIHFVLFENSLELAFFFFILFQYDFHSCIMGKVHFVAPRIAIGVFVQFMCIYRTLPLYAIVKSQIPSEEKQSDDEENEMCVVLERIEEHLKENRSEGCREESLADLDKIKRRLKENEMDKEKEMWIVTWISERIKEISKWIEKISKWIDEVRNRSKETRSKRVAAKNEPIQTGSREGPNGLV